MNSIYFMFFNVVYLAIFSQQQQVNVFTQNNINTPAQYIQSNILTNTANQMVDNNNNEFDLAAHQQQQINFFDNNIGNDIEQQSSNTSKQINLDANSSRKGFDMSINLSSRSFVLSSNKKTHKHTFHKKLTKFNRNIYGKIILHKKSKHLVDVCFNWSK